jgi:hypothetical protein
VQLQGAVSKFQAQGFGIAAISYDNVDVLKTFAERVGITYPLLSDPNSAVIRAFGILNTAVPPNIPEFGIPHPGMFIVDAQGRVVAKYFEQNYRERFTPDTIITKQFGPGGGRKVEITSEHLTATTWISQENARAGNRVTLVMEAVLPPSMHVYAPGVVGYRPIQLKIEIDPALSVHAPQFPPARVKLLPAINERVPVYEGKVRIERDFTISAGIQPGRINVRGTLEYQACDDTVCYVPKTIPFAFTIGIESLDRQRVPEPLRRKAPASP